ncbi:hypothetical protein [Streptomyces noursei]
MTTESGADIASPTKKQCREYADCHGLPYVDLDGTQVGFKDNFWEPFKKKFEADPPLIKASGWRPRGYWVPMPIGTPDDEKYEVGDVVFTDNGLYLCKRHHRSETTDKPDVGTNWETYWDVVYRAAGAEAARPGFGVFSWAGDAFLSGSETRIVLSEDVYSYKLTLRDGKVFPDEANKVWEATARVYGLANGSANVRVTIDGLQLDDGDPGATHYNAVPEVGGAPQFSALATGSCIVRKGDAIGPVLVEALAPQDRTVHASRVALTVKEIGWL